MRRYGIFIYLKQKYLLSFYKNNFKHFFISYLSIWLCQPADAQQIPEKKEPKSMHEKYEKVYKCILDHHWANKVEKKIPKKCQKLAGNSLLITALWCLSLLTAKQQNMHTHDRADGVVGLYKDKLGAGGPW